MTSPLSERRRSMTHKRSGIGRTLKQLAATAVWKASASRRRQGCLALMYHRVGDDRDPLPHLDIEDFRQQIRWLVEHCDVIGAEQLKSAAHGPRGPRMPVLLTFDDGSRDYYDFVYPVLKEFGVPAVVFLVTDYVDHPRLFWFDRLQLAVHAAEVDHVTLPWNPDRTLALGREQNGAAIDECKRYLKGVADEVKERLLEQLHCALGKPSLPDLGRQVMSWDEVRATMDLTTYGGHTHTHPLMSKIDGARLHEEIRLCRDRIATETHTAPSFFAYPNGDFTADVKSAVADHGFDVAFSTINGINDQTTDWREVRRLGVGHVVPTEWMMTQSWM
jgi:peptidoglycan/xylan/chitin deacetylase (PgdA/CDA1 family)